MPSHFLFSPQGIRVIESPFGEFFSRLRGGQVFLHQSGDVWDGLEVVVCGFFDDADCAVCEVLGGGDCGGVGVVAAPVSG